jgi:hypothetical protein
MKTSSSSFIIGTRISLTFHRQSMTSFIKELKRIHGTHPIEASRLGAAATSWEELTDPK